MRPSSSLSCGVSPHTPLPVSRRTPSRCGLHTRTVTVCRGRYPKASDTSSPPCLLRWLPAGAVAGWDLHPLEKRRLLTAHVDSRPPAVQSIVPFGTVPAGPAHYSRSSQRINSTLG